MQFGNVIPDELPLIDFTLPKDAVITSQVLKKSPIQLEVRVGATQWGPKEWGGLIYPRKTKNADFLGQYVKHFNAIELNTTFYSIPPLETLEKWKTLAEVNSDFRFCPKFAQSITHIRRLKNADEITKKFYDAVKVFGNQLGPMYLQLSEPFSPTSFANLKDYLSDLPRELPVHVELRHKEWFGNEAINRDVFSFFNRLNIGTVISDTPGRRDCVHMALTTSNAFIRFRGVGSPYDERRLHQWVQRISEWKDAGLKSVWFFVHQSAERHTPHTIDYFIEKLNERLGMNIQRPKFIR